MVPTELRPSLTGTRRAPLPPSVTLKMPTVLSALPLHGAGRRKSTFSESLKFDRAIDAQIEGRAAFGQGALELDVHGHHGAVHDRRIHSDDAAGNDPVASIDFGDLANEDVLGLGLGDFDRRLEVGGVDDFRECGRGDDALAGLQHDGVADLLEHAVNAWRGLAVLQLARA